MPVELDLCAVELSGAIVRRYVDHGRRVHQLHPMDVPLVGEEADSAD
ncbi:hypothetical protein [Streptomyces sp. NPDC055134]